MEVTNQKVMPLGIILALLVILDLFFIYNIFIAESVILNENHSFDFGSALIEKQTFISDKQHYETFNLIASDFSDISLLVVVPKMLAAKAEDISIKTDLSFELFDDSVLKFEQKKTGAKFSARIDYENKFGNYCSYAIIMPKKYLADLTNEKETLLKEKLNKYALQENSCEEVKKINENLAEEFAKIFAEEKFAEENFSNEKIILFDAADDKYLAALDSAANGLVVDNAEPKVEEKADGTYIDGVRIDTATVGMTSTIKPLDGIKTIIFIRPQYNLNNVKLELLNEKDEKIIELPIWHIGNYDPSFGMPSFYESELDPAKKSMLTSTNKLEQVKSYYSEWDGFVNGKLAEEGRYFARLVVKDEIIPSKAYATLSYNLGKLDIEEMPGILVNEFYYNEIFLAKNITSDEAKAVVYPAKDENNFGFNELLESVTKPKIEVKPKEDNPISEKNIIIETNAEPIYKYYMNKVVVEELNQRLSVDEKKVIGKLAEHSDTTDKNTYLSRAKSKFEASLNEKEKVALKSLTERKIITLGFPYVITMKATSNESIAENSSYGCDVSIDFGKGKKTALNLKVFTLNFEIITEKDDPAFKSECLNAYKGEINEITLDELNNYKERYGYWLIYEAVKNYPSIFVAKNLSKLVLFKSPAAELSNMEDYTKETPKAIESEKCIQELKYKKVIYLDINGEKNTGWIPPIFTHKFMHTFRENYVSIQYSPDNYFDLNQVMINSYVNPMLLDIEKEKAKTKLLEFVAKKCKKSDIDFNSLNTDSQKKYLKENCSAKDFDKFIRENHLFEELWDSKLKGISLEEDFVKVGEENLALLSDYSKKDKIIENAKSGIFRESLRRASDGLGISVFKTEENSGSIRYLQYSISLEEQLLSIYYELNNKITNGKVEIKIINGLTVKTIAEKGLREEEFSERVQHSVKFNYSLSELLGKKVFACLTVKKNENSQNESECIDLSSKFAKKLIIHSIIQKENLNLVITYMTHIKFKEIKIYAKEISENTKADAEKLIYEINAGNAFTGYDNLLAAGMHSLNVNMEGKLEYKAYSIRFGGLTNNGEKIQDTYLITLPKPDLEKERDASITFSVQDEKIDKDIKIKRIYETTEDKYLLGLENKTDINIPLKITIMGIFSAYSLVLKSEGKKTSVGGEIADSSVSEYTYHTDEKEIIIKNPEDTDYSICLDVLFEPNGKPYSKCIAFSVILPKFEASPKVLNPKDSYIDLKYSLIEDFESYRVIADGIEIINKEETGGKSYSIYGSEEFKKMGRNKIMRGIPLDSLKVKETKTENIGAYKVTVFDTTEMKTKEITVDAQEITSAAYKLALGEHKICLRAIKENNIIEMCDTFTVDSSKELEKEEKPECFPLAENKNFGLDIVFILINIGEKKYSKADFAEFAKPIIEAFKSVEPFSEFKDYLNFYGTIYTTTDGVGKNSCTKADTKIYLVDTERRSHASFGGNSYVYFINEDYLPLLVLHEFGHSFCKLADEYEYTQKFDPDKFVDGSPAIIPTEKANCLGTKNICSAKYAKAGDKIDCYDGCSYKGYYRQWFNSIMRNHRSNPQKFNPVSYYTCYEKLRWYT